MAGADASYPGLDLLGRFPPGVVPTRESHEAVVLAFQANGGRPLSDEQLQAAAGPSPAYPTSLPRLGEG